MHCKINNNSNFDVSEIEDLIHDLFSFSQKRHGFKKPVTLNLMSDESNTSPLGKTAHYDPSSMEIVVYVDKRHPKDIMRSFSHELVHHYQNENGMFDDNTGMNGEGYAQSNPHLRKMEKEAYLKGNMCFRDWEDGYKSSNPNILNERRIYKMSTKDWKDKELNGLLNERWGFSMDLNKLNESNCNSAAKKDELYEEEESSEEECPKCKAKPCHCNVKKEEKDNKKTDKYDDNPKLKGKQKNLPDALQKGIIGSTEINEGESELEEIKAMVRQNFEGEELDDNMINQIAKMIKAKRDKNKAPPPKSGGNSGSGAPAQPSMQEQKLREAIRRIIRKQLKK